MRRWATLFALAALLLSLAGCAGSARQPGGDVAFQQIEEQNLPAEVKAWADSMISGSNGPVNAVRTIGGKTYLLVYAGMRPTGGYQVLVEKVTLVDGQLQVEAAIVAPSGMATEAITYPYAVAAVPKHEGEAVFTVTRRGGRPIQLGNPAIDPAAVAALQSRVDEGHQPWRLDPVQVAMDDGRAFGFDSAAGDTFRLERLVETGSGSGTGEAYVEAIHNGKSYVIELIQPLGPGRNKIWVINSIREK